MTPLPIAVEGTLTIHGPDMDVRVRADAHEIVCDLMTLKTAWTLFRAARHGSGGRLPLAAFVDRLGVPVRLCVRGRTVAELGSGARPGRLASLLGLPGMRLWSGR